MSRIRGPGLRPGGLLLVAAVLPALLLAPARCLAEPPAPRAAPAPPRAPAWRATPAGLEVRVHEAARPTEPAWVVLVRLDPRRHEIRVAPTRDAARRVDAVAASDPQSLAVINGGFFDQAGRPMGWLVADGRVLSPLRTRGWSAFVVPPGGQAPRIVSAREARSQAALHAVQAGPRLVAGGRPVALKPQSALRAFIGLDAGRRIVLGSTGPLPADLPALAAWLAEDESRHGAGLVEALALDGGSSAQLWVRDGSPLGGDLHLPGLAEVPDVLVVVPRPDAGKRRPDQ